MSNRNASNEVAARSDALSTVSRILALLHARLPEGAALAVCWRDWALGQDGAQSPGAPDSLQPAGRAGAVRAIVRARAAGCAGACLGQSECNTRIALAVASPRALSPGEQADWLALAQGFVALMLDAMRAHARVLSLEKSKRLQQALYEIADLVEAPTWRCRRCCAASTSSSPP